MPNYYQKFKIPSSIKNIKGFQMVKEIVYYILTNLNLHNSNAIFIWICQLIIIY